MRIIEDSFISEILSRRISCQILFPHDSICSKAQKKLPVLYLLHGLFGEAKNWMQYTEISSLIENLSFAVATFDGENSWYADGIQGKQSFYESFFTGEFIPHIENEYKIGGKRRKRAVAGLSMGGYGALKFALKHPSLFIWAGSMSGAFDAPRQTDERPGPDWEILGDSIKTVFGEVQDSDSRIKNDLFHIISELKKDDLETLPNIYFDCGRDDNFIKVNRELFKKFKEKEVSCDFYEQSGGHDWTYWNRQMKKMLLVAEESFKS